MVHNQNYSSSDINDDSDCCKDCKEHYFFAKEKCDWIKCRVCENWRHEYCTIFSKNLHLLRMQQPS